MRRILQFVLACALVCPAFAQTYQRTAGLCADGGQVEVVNGTIASGIVPIGSISPAFTNGTGVVGSYPGCTVTVYNTGTLTLSTIYSDSIGTPKANPFTASLVDGYWFFYAANGAYDVQLSGAGIITPFLTNTFTVNFAAGSNTDVQYNCSGLFCGSNNLTWTNGSSTLAVTGLETISTSLAINGGTPLTTTNRTGTGNLVLATSPTLVTPTLTNPTSTTGSFTSPLITTGTLDTPTLTNSLLFTSLASGSLSILHGGVGDDRFRFENSAASSVLELLGVGANTTTATMNANTTLGVNGTVEFQILDASLASGSGWFFNSTTANKEVAISALAPANALIVDDSGKLRAGVYFQSDIIARFQGSIYNDGTAFKHGRFLSGSVCTTGASIGNTCNNTVTWTTPFPDTSYTVGANCAGSEANSPYVSGISSVNAGSIVVTIGAGATGGATCLELEVWAFHD